MDSWWRLKKYFLGILSLALILFGLFLLNGNEDRKVNIYSETLIETCQDSSWLPGCYYEELFQLMEKITMTEAFNVVGLLQQKDLGNQNCHLLGHAISGGETAKNTSKWAEVAASCPVGTVCGGIGCVHGAFLEKIQTNPPTERELPELINGLTSLCDKGDSQTILERKQCYHALGHVLIFAEASNIKKTISSCDFFTPENKKENNFREDCYDGAFMEFFNPITVGDSIILAKKDLDSDQAMSLCSSFGGSKKSACWREAWIFSDSDIFTAEGIKEYCSFLENEGNKDCYDLLVIANALELQYEPERVSVFCLSLGREKASDCFNVLVNKMIRNNYMHERIYEICKKSKSSGFGESCYEEAVLRANQAFLGNSQEKKDFCSGLPKRWGSICFKGL